MKDTWVAQSVKRPTLDFCSGHDLTIMESSPTLGSVLGVGLAWDSLSLSAPPLITLSLSKLTNKQKQNKTDEHMGKGRKNKNREGGKP